MARPENLLVVGAGLIGTSVALAGRAAGKIVTVADTDPARLATAVALGAGSPAEWPAPTGDGTVDLVVVATPPTAIAPVVIRALSSYVEATVTHVGSVQAQPQREIEASGVALDRFVGGHPIAGRERSGPGHAEAGLFVRRPWIVCPTSASSALAIETVREMAMACGAEPTVMTAAVHDTLFARLSHVPQLVASALAASLAAVDPALVALAGPGIRDTTRLAESDPALWGQVVAANREAVAAALAAVAAPLQSLAAALASPSAGAEDVAAAVHDLIAAGRSGRALLPGKHGGAPTRVANLQVAVPDEPGALARLLDAVAAEGVNLEDLRVEHAPGQAAGVAEIVVRPESVQQLVDALSALGWAVSSTATGAL